MSYAEKDARPNSPRPIVPVGDRIVNRIDDQISRISGLRNRLSMSVDAITGPRNDGRPELTAVSKPAGGVHDRLNNLDTALSILEEEITRLED